MFDLREGQRVAVVVDSKLFDTGRISRVGHGDGGPDTDASIVVRSDTLKGKEVVFQYSEMEESWTRFFQDPLADAGILCYSKREQSYQIEALD